MLKNKPKKLHIGLWITGILLAGAGIFSFWISYHYKGIIRQQLPSIIAKNTDSLYNVSLGDISINIITRTVTLKNVRFAPDTVRRQFLKDNNRLPSNLFSVAVTEIHIAGIEWENLAANNSFDCKYIIVNSPSVLIDGAPKPLDSLTGKDTGTNSTAMESISVDKISVLNPTLSYHYVNDSTDYTLWGKGGKVLLSDWKFEPGKGPKHGTFFLARSSVIGIDSFNYVNKGGLYNFGAAGVAFSSGDRNLTLENVFIKLNGTREQFYKRIGYQREIYDLLFPKVEIRGLNWEELLTGKEISADTMNMTDPSLDLYFSRALPANTKSKMGHYPHQLLSKCGIKINISNTFLTNGHFKYTELSEKTNKEGVVVFNKVNGSINNITNIEDQLATNDKCFIKLKGKYMNHGDIAATFMLLLSDPRGYFTVDGSAANITAADVNQPAKNLGLIEVAGFHLTRLDMHVEGNENYGKGNYTMLYEGLNINFLRLNDDNTTDKKGRKTASMLANALALYPSNPLPGKEVRHMNSYIKRESTKGFFNLIWKNIFMGANNTALRNPELVANVKGAVKAETPEMKKTFLKKIFGRKKH